MNQRIALGLTLLTGIAIGATAIQGLHAQAKPPTYAVIAVRKMNDAEAFKTVIAKGPAAAEAFGGKFVARTDQVTSLDGALMIAFDSVEKAQAWHNSAAEKEIDAIRIK
jgi:uncharacterized protein (DUF1330 family)